MSEQMRTFDQWWTEIEGFSFRGQRLCELLNKPSLAQVAYDEGVAAALATQPQAPQGGWQPIETAPKDGTRILGYGLLGFEQKPGIGTVSYADKQFSCEPNEATEYDMEACNLTHWQPLPTAPTKTPEVQE